MIQNYSLPDLKLFTPMPSENKEIIVWQPDKTIAVIGNGSNIENELKIYNIERDNIPVYRRKTGGLSVILSNKMLCVSIAYYNKNLVDPIIFFQNSNKIIINALKSFGINNLRMQGISDLTINNKKISGSSIFQSNKLKFFHSVINVKENVNLFEKYLKHPPREPQYRSGRSHGDFVTSLFKEGYEVDFNDLKNAVLEEWNKAF